MNLATLWRLALVASACALALACEAESAAPAGAPDAGAAAEAGAEPDADEPDADGPDGLANPEAVEDAPAPPPVYPEPGDWEANAGPGGPARAFTQDELNLTCAYVDGGEGDPFDHHNLLVMYDGWLLMPYAPEWGQGGLTFYDFSDPCAPQIVGEGFSETMRESHSIGFSSHGGRWAVVNQISEIQVGGIQFWDVSDTSAPVAVADLPLEPFLYPDAYDWVTLSVFWQAPYVYVAHANAGVQIVDASDPTTPVHVKTYTFDPILKAGQIHAVGNLLIVTEAGGPRTALLDISDPADPQPIPGGDFIIEDFEGKPRSAYFSNIANGYVWYARKDKGGGLIVYDITDPTTPTRAGGYRSDGDGGYVFIKDELAFVGESNFGAVYDISDLDAIHEVSRVLLKGDLDTLVPIGNVMILSVDDKAHANEGSAVAPFALEPDIRAPRVTWVWPPEGATDLALTTRVGMTFSEMVDVKSAWEGSVRLYEAGTAPEYAKVEGVVSAQENVVNFWPLSPLKPGTTYTLEVPEGGVADYNGNPIAEPFTMSFTTASQ